jgi:hypothetical protein
VFSGEASFGGEAIVGGNQHDVVLAGYNANGDHLWSHGFVGAGFDQALDLEVSGNGIYVTGRFKDDLTLGDMVLNSNVGNYDVFVCRFATSTGLPVWAKVVGSNDNDQGNGLGVAGDGGIFVGGYVLGDITFGGVNTPAPGNNTDAFILRFTE